MPIQQVKKAVKGIKFGTIRQYRALIPEEDTLYFITDVGLILRGDSIVVPLNYTTYNVSEGNAAETGEVQFNVETYTDPQQPPTLQSFTVCTKAAVQAIKRTLEVAISAHASAMANNEDLGHVILSDAIDDDEHDAAAGVAATPQAVYDALAEAKAYAESILGEAAGAMVLKGTIGAAADGADVLALPDDPRVGWTYIVVTAGTYGGQACTVGDEIVCTGFNRDPIWKRIHTEANPNMVTATGTLAAGQLVVGGGNKTATTLPNGMDGQQLVMRGDTPAWDEIENAEHGIAFGFCHSESSNDVKEVIVRNFKLQIGAIVSVTFEHAVTGRCSLSVYDLNDADHQVIDVIYHRSFIQEGVIGAGDTATFRYDGTSWVLTAIDKTHASLSELDNDIVGHANCNTASTIQGKRVTLPNFVVASGAILAVHFDYNVNSDASLEVNNTGRNPIYHRAAPIQNGAIRGGDTATFVFNGTAWHLIAVERPYDSSPTVGSHNLLDSDAVYNAIEDAMLYWEEM